VIKKVLAVVMTVIMFFSMFSFTSRAQAAGLIRYMGGLFISGKGLTFVFEGSGYRNRDVRNATIFAGSNFHNLSCSAKKEPERIVCVAGGRLTEYVGETGVIHLAGQVFYVTIPGTDLMDRRCDEEDVLGADVQFEDINGIFTSDFVPGETLDDIQKAAGQHVISNQLDGYEVVSKISCGSDEGAGSEEGGGGEEEEL